MIKKVKTIASTRYTQRSELDSVIFRDMRKLRLFCILFCRITESGRPVLSVQSHYDSDVTLDKMLELRSLPDVIYCDSFTRTIYMAEGHPLWPYGEPVITIKNAVKIEKD